MKKKLLQLSAVLLGFCGSTSYASCDQYMVVGHGVRLREKPSITSKVVRKLFFHKKLCVKKADGDWLKVDDGWVYHGLLVPYQYIAKKKSRTYGEGVKRTGYKPSYFSDNVTKNRRYTYNSSELNQIYGPQKDFDIVRPLIEWGRRMYDYEPFPASTHFMGKMNPTMPQTLVYGNWRNVYGINRNQNNVENNVLLTDLNLEIYQQLTATELLHFGFSPFQINGELPRVDFSNNSTRVFVPPGVTLNNLYFEGDLGSILTGIRGKYSSFDLPFAVGLMPLFYQNGTWFNDTILGAAFAYSNWTSKDFHISRGETSVFLGFDRSSSGAFTDSSGQLQLRQGKVFGVMNFLEATEGYWELGYAYAQSPLDRLNYQDIGVSFSRRYGRISNTARVIYAFGQHPLNGRAKTADGAVFILENSYATHLPLTLVPYFDIFYGVGRPQPASQFNAVGVLQNQGLNFASDAQTGFPNLDNSAADTYGGALGLEYLFNLEQQLVVEIAGVYPHGNENPNNLTARPLKGGQTAFGVRYQRRFARAWIFRTDGIIGRQSKKNANGRKTFSGMRVELQRKF